MKKIFILGVILLFSSLMFVGCTEQPPEFFMAQKIAKDLKENYRDYEVMQVPNVDLTLKNTKKKIIISYYKPSQSKNILGAVLINSIQPYSNSVRMNSDTDAFDVLEEPLQKFKSANPSIIEDISSRFENNPQDSVTNQK